MPSVDAEPVRGEALGELAKQYAMAESVMARLSRFMDQKALAAIVGGVDIKLGSAEEAEQSAQALQAVLQDPVMPELVTVFSQYDEAAETYRLRVHRQHHGNVRITPLDSDFVQGADYGVLHQTSETFKSFIGEGAVVSRGEGEKRREQAIADFGQAMTWLRSEAERGVSKQRYKGLGEMNPSQLWETTMDPTVRRLMRVQIEDALSADQMFTTLMGDQVEPRREFIEAHALQAANIDI